uniref:Uncharacterized protein n=1 Tax=Tanacetum cinerariifolium TaxID=118510 RepID=A0A699K088_TANCI|nr:hypothetical protein [Tanacetum cinerariifolium]
MLQKSIVSLFDASTNKALQVAEDPPCLQSLLNGEHERLALIHRATTELVYLGKTQHHLNPVFIPNHDSPRRIDDGVVMLVLEARGIPLRIVVFGTTSERYHTLPQYRICTPLQSKTDLAPFSLAQHHDSMPPSSLRWIVQELVAFFHLVLKMNHIRMKDFNDFKCGAFQVLRFKEEVNSWTPELMPSYSLGRAHQMTESSKQVPEWQVVLLQKGAISSSIYRSAGVNEIDDLSLIGGGGGIWDDPEALGAPEALDSPAGGGGGELQTATCGLYEICRIRFPICVGEGSLSCQLPFIDTLHHHGLCGALLLSL